MTLVRWLSAACVGLFVHLNTACAPRPVVLHPDFGTSYELISDSQALNPPPADPTRPVDGIDGYAASTTMYGYRKRFEPRESTSQGGSIISQGIQTR